MRNMEQRIEEAEREAILVEDAARIRVMGNAVLEPVPSRRVPYDGDDRQPPEVREQ